MDYPEFFTISTPPPTPLTKKEESWKPHHWLLQDWIKLVLIAIFIVIVFLVTPFCCSYLIYLSYMTFVTSTNYFNLWEVLMLQAEKPKTWLGAIFELYCLMEFLFVISYYGFVRHIQAPMKSPNYTFEEHRNTLRHIIHSTDSIKDLLQGWFEGAKFEDIRRDNIKGIVIFFS